MKPTRSRLTQLGDIVLPQAHAPATVAAEGLVYHLAEGLVLTIGPNASRLLDLAHDDDLQIDFRYIEPLEKLALGWDLRGMESMIERLLREGIIVAGAAGPDGYLRSKLEQLDAVYLDGYLGELSPRARAAYALLLDAHARRKRFFEQVGQCPVLPETALRRALSVGDAEEVGRKRVLCLGDDDLVSVALAALGHEVTVYDIDDFLLTFLRRATAELGLAMEIAEADLRDPLRTTQREHFDVVVTDPMSNRDCFELFLSRAFSMLVPGGRVFVAVYPATAGLFRQVSEELRFPILAWHARHNRYYSHYLKLHWYESDWVEVQKTADTRVKYPPEEFCVPLNLYREDFFQRLPTFIGFYDAIEEPQYARPLFLDMLIDVVEATAGVKLVDRRMHAAGDWTVIHGLTDGGHLTLHVDRARRQLTVDLYPFVPAIEDALRHFIMAAYKSRATDAGLRTTSAAWELRVR